MSAEKPNAERLLRAQADELNQCLQIIVTQAGNILDDLHEMKNAGVGSAIPDAVRAIEAAVTRASKVTWASPQSVPSSLPPLPIYMQKRLAEADSAMRESQNRQCALIIADALERRRFIGVDFVRDVVNQVTDTLNELDRSTASAVGQPSLEKLRELEAKWRNRVTSITAMFPGDQAAERVEVCADELRAVLAEFEKEGK